jgi:hypothetical protein
VMALIFQIKIDRTMTMTTGL